MLRNMRNSKGAGLVFLAVLVLATISLLYTDLDHPLSFLPTPGTSQNVGLETDAISTPADHLLLDDIVQYFTDFPITTPYKDGFGEQGRRTKILGDCLIWVEKLPLDAPNKRILQDAVERIAMSLYPFLRGSPKKLNSHTPLSDLRSSFDTDTAGIVIPTGDKTVRFAAHLIESLHSVLGSSLPIQIAYAGDADLSPKSRDRLAKLGGAGSVEFLDITTVFIDSSLRFNEASGGWALKPFAALASRFEKVILLDADSVFFQKPEVLLQQSGFLKSGAFLFHDRLLWQHGFPERHAWWREQIRRPSATLNKSRVWKEDFAEEGDSGVVVVDKSQVNVLIGLLHICWQNMYDVREEITYKMTYGDKESWWLGFELTGSSYEMEEHYGAIVGWEERDEQGHSKVCSFVIAHVDENDQLLWYNGGLLKNKALSATEYEVPDKWMIDAEWQKGATRQDMSCMAGSKIQNLTDEESRVLQKSIEAAKIIDEGFL